MKVYLRGEMDIDGVYFCDWSPDRMEELVQTLKRGGGVHIEDWEQDMSYQFILHDGHAGAEIVIHDQDDGS